MSSTTALINDYHEKLEEFAVHLLDLNISMNPIVDRFNRAWVAAINELEWKCGNSMEDKLIHMVFSKSKRYFKNIGNIRNFFAMQVENGQKRLKYLYCNKEVIENLGFCGSGRHAHIKYLTKAFIVFMRYYYGEKESLNQILRLWEIC